MSMKIDEQEYQVDFKLLDKYHGFSSEILKLSLTGIALFGVLAKAKWLNLRDSFYFIAVAIVLFGLSAAFSLAHRYLSNEGMFYHVRNLRKKLDEDAKERKKYFKRSEFYMKLSALFLGVASLCLAIGLGIGIVFSSNG